MIKKLIIPKLPYEKAIKTMFGSEWRSLPKNDIDGAFGIAIVFSVLRGTSPDLYAIAKDLNIHTDLICDAFNRLGGNGVFLRGKIEEDRKKIKSMDYTVLGYYAGYASGYCGLIGSESK